MCTGNGNVIEVTQSSHALPVFVVPGVTEPVAVAAAYTPHTVAVAVAVLVRVGVMVAGTPVLVGVLVQGTGSTGWRCE